MKSGNCIDTISTSPAQHGFGLPPWFMALFRKIMHWGELHRQRIHLAQLDDRMLRDIGLSQMDVRIEIEKPFWRY